MFLSPRYTADIPPDFSTLLRQSSPTIPIIMIFDTEADTAVKLFTDFANRKQNRHVEIYLTDNSSAPERVVRKQIQKGMAEVCWNDIWYSALCLHFTGQKLLTVSGIFWSLLPGFSLGTLVSTPPSTVNGSANKMKLK